MLRHSDSGAYENAFPAYRERSLPTHEHSIPALSEDQPFPFSLRRLQCSHNLGAKKAPVVLELVKRRKQSCFAHGFEPEKSLSTCIGEPVCPGDFELHQSLQFKFAIDVFLRVILCQRTHRASRSLTGRTLMQSEKMRSGDEHIALPFGSRLDFAVLSLDGSRFTAGCCTGGSIARGCSRLTVDFLADALHGALQVIARSAHTREITARKCIAHGLDLVLDLTA